MKGRTFRMFVKRDPLILFVSTGRCGTQWLAANLARLYGDVAEVTHEPIGPRYNPRRYFRRPADVDQMLQDENIAPHLRRIGSVLDTRTYIETGWPLFSAVPGFLRRFGSSVRLVHLTRHPVPSAISHMVHKTYYGSPRVDYYTTLAALDPSCEGAFQRELRERWPQMTPYERTLFWWTEVHLYAEELEQLHPHVPFCRIRSEDIFQDGGAALAKICDFADLPFRAELTEALNEKVDRWHHRTDQEFDWEAIRRYPRTVELARRLGYDVDDVDPRRLTERYSGSPASFQDAARR